MTPEEKFNKITAYIEEKAKKRHESTAKISADIAKKMFMSERELNGIFVFMTGVSMKNYIRTRKMMASYEFLLDSDVFDIQAAIEFTGHSDNPAYTKSFKQCFGVTPSEAFLKKDRNLIRLRLRWESLSTIDADNQPQTFSKNNFKGKTLFGVERTKVNEIKDIIELQESFSFDELQSETAYEIHKTYNVTMWEAFKFVSEYERG